MKQQNNIKDEAVKSDNTTIFSPSPTIPQRITTPIHENREQSDTVSQNINEWRYPNTFENDGRMTSTDSTDVITEWYKDKIRSHGYSSKSYIQTKSNGNIENKLVGARETKQVRITITRKNEDSLTTILVNTN